MFKINWSKEWDRLHVATDRRTGDTFLLKQMHPTQSLSKHVPVMLVEQETLGL